MQPTSSSSGINSLIANANVCIHVCVCVCVRERERERERKKEHLKDEDVKKISYYWE